jgi:hypothetical protein
MGVHCGRVDERQDQTGGRAALVPPGAIEHEHGVGAGRDGAGDLREM